MAEIGRGTVGDIDRDILTGSAITERNSMSDDSVTQWIDRIKTGDQRAAEQIWHRYFEKLVRYATKKLSGSPRRVADEEDVALSAFGSFYRNAAAGRFPILHDRDDLWKIMFTITERKALDQVKFHRRLKRGGGKVRGESAVDTERIRRRRTSATMWPD